MPDEDRSLFKAAAEEISPLYPYEPGFFTTERSDSRELGNEMDDDIGRGFETPILVLLIHHLSRLHTFRMTDYTMSDTFQMFMRRIAANYQNTSLAPRMPLRHLRLAAIAHHDTENSCSVDWAVYFLCVPSLKTFAAFMMGSEEISEYEENSEAYLRNTANAPVSNVEELYFQNCQFDPESFDTLLPMIKDLKRFSYDAGGHIVAQQDCEPRKVIRALVNHVGHSLEELDFAEVTIGSEDGEEDIKSVSTRGFKKLKALHCETRWLLRKPEDLWGDIDSDDDKELSKDHHFVENPIEERVVYSEDPRDNLPDSLEYLYLDGIYKDDEWKQMTEMFKTTNANTPKLTLENTCINRDDKAKYGHAVEPHVRFANLLLEHIWRGHS